jgi:hypothetical protein
LTAALALLALAADAWPKAEVVRRYEEYIRRTEARIQREVQTQTFLWAAQSPARWARVRAGEVVVEPVTEQGDVELGDGIIHDWIGAYFISGVKLAQAEAFLQDYSIHKSFFRPEVIDSQLLSRSGEEYHLYYRFVKKKILTVTMNTEHTAVHYPISPTRLATASWATRIAEVKDAGKPNERELPPGKDHGFLWRLNTYWRMEEKDGGVYIECQTVSLTRPVALGLGWLINPIIRTLPRESLAHILTAAAAGVRSRARR